MLDRFSSFSIHRSDGSSEASRFTGRLAAGEPIHLGPGDDRYAALEGVTLMSGQSFTRFPRYADETDGSIAPRGGEPIRLGGGDDNYAGGPDADRIFGGTGNDLIHGGSGDDKIQGGSGNDVLAGDSGSDYLSGGAGNDSLTGDKGNDYYYGGAGADNFWVSSQGHDTIIYRDVTESDGANRDTVKGDVGKHVTIDLQKIDADALTPENDSFTWVGAGAFSGTAGELRYQTEDDGALLQGDVNGDGAADFEVYFLTFAPLQLTEKTFEL